MNEQEVRKILREMLMVKSFGKSTLEYDEVIDKALASLKSLEPKVDAIANILAKELPINYDGTNPGNWHILVSVATAIVNYLKGKKYPEP